MKLKRGSTSVRRLVFIGDSSSTTGGGLTGLVYNSASLVAYYFAGDLSNEVAISLASATLGTFTSGGFVEVDATNMPGWYEIGIPDAALDAGNEVAIQLRGATNMVPVNIYIELDTVDYQTAAFGANTVAPATATDVTDAVASLTSFPSSGPVERSPNDTKAIAFSWPVSGATITADVSLDNAAYAACTGTVSFLRTEGSSHYYSLSYHADDRPTAEGTARYQLDDGTYTQYFTLRVEGAITDAAGIRSAVGLSAANLDTQLGDIIDDTTIIKTTANVPKEAF